MKKNGYPKFIGSDFKAPDDAFFQIIPVPFEKSVCYGRGTARGPEAIINASLQLELFDSKSVPAEYGINTLPPVDCGGSPEKTLDSISSAFRKIMSLGKIPVMLGGEHTVTCGAIAAIKEKYRDFGVVHFDAHADLKDRYYDNPLSHACVMRRVFDMGVQIFQIGVRSLTLEEETFRKENRIGHIDAEEAAVKPLPYRILSESFPKDIYISFDVDALDPSLIPSTGTPEPGGLLWFQTLNMIEAIVKNRNVIGMDFVELAPISGMHSPDFAIARLVYNTFGIITRNMH